ncbi:MAG TPA: hypothetical protein PKV72_04780 [Candidatus Peribacteria bacterium]|nr:hypothetical protein [Candidatus Peribacteria bacterium]
MALNSPRDFNKLLAECKGNRDEFLEYLRLEVGEDPDVVLRLADRVQGFLGVDEIRSAMETVLNGGRPERYLGYFDRVQRFFPDEELRPRMVEVHKTHPWLFYTHGSTLESLFPNEYFRRLMADGTDIFTDPDLLRIFQLFNAEMPIISYSEQIRNRMRMLLETEEQADVYVEQPKEAGFACGGMEKNFLQAARERRGLVAVNGGQLLAKHFHAKGADKAKKVSYVAPKTQETVEGYMLWGDYIYAPTDGQHVHVIEALERGERDVTIDHLTVKPVRPLIGTTSKQIFDAFHGADAAS